MGYYSFDKYKPKCSGFHNMRVNQEKKEQRKLEKQKRKEDYPWLMPNR